MPSEIDPRLFTYGTFGNALAQAQQQADALDMMRLQQQDMQQGVIGPFGQLGQLGQIGGTSSFAVANIELLRQQRAILTQRYHSEPIEDMGGEVGARNYWRQVMPATGATPLIALVPRVVRCVFQGFVFNARLICVNNNLTSFQLIDQPFAGTVVVIDVPFSEPDGVINLEEEIKRVLGAEWPQYANEWRITPSGAVRTTEEERSFQAEQLQAEQAGVLGP